MGNLIEGALIVWIFAGLAFASHVIVETIFIIKEFRQQ